MLTNEFLRVPFRLLTATAVMPRKAYPSDAGFDLFVSETTVVMPWTPEQPCVDLPSGIAIDVPEGWHCRIVGRSSALRKKHLQVFEGVIDSGYQGELFATVASADTKPVSVEAGTSVAQLIFMPVLPVGLYPVPEFRKSARGTNGFGSSGS